MSPDKSTLDQLRIDRREAPRRSWGSVLVLVLLLLGAVVAGLLWWKNRPATAVVHTVAVQAAAASGQKTLLNASGYVTARRIATVSSKVSGKVMEVLVEEGMKVEAGQILARLDPSNVTKSLSLAEAQLESASKGLDETQANLDKAQRDFRRVAQLATNQIASPLDLDRAEAEAKALAARLAKQKADVAVAANEVEVWKQQLDDTVIRAPFPGIVTSKNAQPGEMISPMSAGGGGSFTRTGICTIVDMTSLEVEVDVSESYINRVTPGQPVEATLDSYPEWKIPTKVIAIIPTADRQKATVKVRVGFEKLDPRILPDMGVKVAFQSAAQPAADAAGSLAAPAEGHRESILIPKAAVRQRDGRDLVWVVSEGKIERRAITIGGTRGDDVTILAGLRGGERLVVEGPDDLADGAKVTEAKR